MVKKRSIKNLRSSIARQLKRLDEWERKRSKNVKYHRTKHIGPWTIKY